MDDFDNALDEAKDGQLLIENATAVLRRYTPGNARTLDVARLYLRLALGPPLVNGEPIPLDPDLALAMAALREQETR